MLRFTFFLALLMAFNLQAQFQPSKIFKPGDAVIVEYSPQLGKVYYHQMEAKETVYTLAKTFGQRISDLSLANPNIDMDKTSIGQTIKVPFLSSLLVKHSRDLLPQNTYVPVYYQVQPKDNFFRIARVYFNQSIENLLDINRLESFDLAVGQKIQVGWMSTSSPKVQTQNVGPETLVHQDKAATPGTVAPKQNTSVSKVEVEEEPAKSKTATKREKTKKSNKFLRRLKKSLGIKSKKKDIKEVVQLSEQLEQRPEFQEPEERKKVLEEKQNEVATPITSIEQPKVEEEKPVFVKPVIEKKPAEEDATTIIEKKKVVPEESTPPVVYKSEKGIAIWNMTSSDSKNMFALHPTAKVGSYIEITNPMMNKTVQAKIIGNIPPRTYTDDVSLVISPRVAKMLGVVDRRFMVQLKYREN